jgi:hypothetical protein
MPDGQRFVPALDPLLAFELGLRHFKLIQRTMTDIDFLYWRSDGRVASGTDAGACRQVHGAWFQG